jgi:pimeloyl-ACP methyl ester carboxylesterase
LLDDHAMAYDMAGEGIPLVFIHQVATDRRLWRHQWASFAGRYLVITVDLLGHGDTVWPLSPAERSIEGAAARVQQLIERLGRGAAFLIGVSMGAAIAMRFALSAPSLVRGLVLLSPWHHVNVYTRNLMDRLFRLAEAGDMVGHTELFLRYVLSVPYRKRHLLEVGQLRAMAMAQDARAVSYAWAVCLAYSVAARLEEIRAPTLVIAGLHDLLTPPYLARDVAKGLCIVELEIWDGAGHFPFLEAPARFNRRLEMFIRRCLA